MSGARPDAPKGRASIVLRLCRGCVEYVYEATSICPRCGADPSTPSERYRADGFALRAAIQVIEDAKSQRSVESADVAP